MLIASRWCLLRFSFTLMPDITAITPFSYYFFRHYLFILDCHYCHSSRFHCFAYCCVLRLRFQPFSHYAIYADIHIFRRHTPLRRHYFVFRFATTLFSHTIRFHAWLAYFHIVLPSLDIGAIATFIKKHYFSHLFSLYACHWYGRHFATFIAAALMLAIFIDSDFSPYFMLTLLILFTLFSLH